MCTSKNLFVFIALLLNLKTISAQECQNQLLKYLKKYEYDKAIESLKNGFKADSEVENYVSHHLKIINFQTILIFNHIDVPPFGAAKITPFHIALENIKKSGLKTSERFLNEYSEIQQRVILAASLGLNGKSTVRERSFELTGSKQRIMREAFLESLSRIDISEHSNAVKTRIQKMIDNTIPTHKIPNMENEFASNAGTDGHSFSFYLNKDKKQILIGNTGFRPDHIPSGILVFSTAQTQDEKLSDFLKFLNTNEDSYFENLYKYAYDLFGSPKFHIPLEEQCVGNCGWIALEMILLSFLYCDGDALQEQTEILKELYRVYTSILDRVYMDRVKTYLTSTSTIKSKELLESCFHFASGTELKKVNFDWNSKDSVISTSSKAGDAHYGLFTSIRDVQMHELAKAELEKYNHQGSLQISEQGSTWHLISGCAVLGLTLYGVYKLTPFSKGV